MTKFLASLAVIFASMPSHIALGEVMHDKGEVLKQVAQKVSTKIQGTFKDDPVKPKLWLAEISNSALNLTKADSEKIVDYLEVELANHVVLVDRDKTKFVAKEEALQASGATAEAAQLGEKIGASHILIIGLRDQSTSVDKDESEVTISAKVTLIEIKTQRKVLATIEDVKYRHEFYQKTSVLRDIASFSLGVTALAGVGGAAYFGSQASASKKKYDAAMTSDDATKYRAETEKNKRIAYGCGGVAVLSIAAKLFLDHAISDSSIYHDYELVLQPTSRNGIEWGLVWNH